MSAYWPALSLIERFLGPEMTKFNSRRIILLLRFSHYRPSVIVPMYQAKDGSRPFFKNKYNYVFVFVFTMSLTLLVCVCVRTWVRARVCVCVCFLLLSAQHYNNPYPRPVSSTICCMHGCRVQ